ncbi:MAG: dipicolinate synthase subunit B [Eubacterium sp.]
MNIGYCLTGSFCTFSKGLKAIEEITDKGHNVIPIMSENAYNTDTRFGKSEDFRDKLIQLTNNDIIHTIVQAEPIGPAKMFDVLIVAPCTGNTLAKLANGITDTCVTMAVKSHLRNSKPVVIGVSTNDALGAAAKNIGMLMNYKNYYFVPMSMDDPSKKPKSIVCDFTRVLETAELAVAGKSVDKKIF